MFEHGWFGGMHMIWWVFWVMLIVSFFVFLEAEPKHKAKRRREKPLDTLKRRYAAGEISTEEYQERKAVLEADAQSENLDNGGNQNPA
jgi:putative membrane protein